MQFSLLATLALAAVTAAAPNPKHTNKFNYFAYTAVELLQFPTEHYCAPHTIKGSATRYACAGLTQVLRGHNKVSLAEFKELHAFVQTKLGKPVQAYSVSNEKLDGYVAAGAHPADTYLLAHGEGCDWRAYAPSSAHGITIGDIKNKKLSADNTKVMNDAIKKAQDKSCTTVWFSGSETPAIPDTALYADDATLLGVALR
jgi:hypothetical protein